MVVELALGVEALDSGVDVGLLLLVDPPWWDPFGEAVGIHLAGPPFLQEVGVVVSAEEGSILRSVGPPRIQSFMWCRSTIGVDVCSRGSCSRRLWRSAPWFDPVRRAVGSA